MISAVYRVLNPFELFYCWKVGVRFSRGKRRL